MKPKLFNILFVLVCAIIIGSCDTNPQALLIQAPYTYSPQYYANLRAYKASDHEIFYGWMASYANKQGVVASYKKSASWGEHIAGLPDSVDFVSLWMGVPTDSLNPIAYNEMLNSMSIRGIKFVAPEIVALESYDTLPLSMVGVQEYARYLVKMVLSNHLNGLDMDYEPSGGQYLDTKSNMDSLVKYCAQSLGPMSSNPNTYLIVDYYSYPPDSYVEPYINYLVNQTYTQGSATTSSATVCQSNYNSVSWCPTKKFIVTENFGTWWATGGVPFTEADGNTLTPSGTKMTSLEGFARWNPTQGKKGGFGAFYFDDDYDNMPPYYYTRNAIQAANPAVK
jgi:hypothetical protein